MGEYNYSGPPVILFLIFCTYINDVMYQVAFNIPGILFFPTNTVKGWFWHFFISPFDLRKANQRPTQQATS